MGILVPDSLLHSGLIQQKLPANSGHGFVDFCHLNVIDGFLGYSQDLPAFVFTSPHPEYCSYMFRRFLTDPTFLALNVQCAWLQPLPRQLLLQECLATSSLLIFLLLFLIPAQQVYTVGPSVRSHSV